MAFSKITDADTNGKGNLGRPDTPGVSTEEMQRILDELPREVIIPKFNELVGALADKTAAALLGAAEGDAATTVQAALEGRYRKSETYSRKETDEAIGEKIVAIGAGDMAMATYDPAGKRKPYLPADEGLDKDTYGGSADGVVAAADQLAAPRRIGNAAFDGSGDITLAEIGAGFTAAVITPGSGYGSSMSRVSASSVYVDVYINLSKSSAIAYLDTICTLPAGARPQTQFDAPAIVRNPGSGGIDFAMVTFATSGAVFFASVTPGSGFSQVIVNTGFALR